jgi:hypothetical protein
MIGKQAECGQLQTVSVTAQIAGKQPFAGESEAQLEGVVCLDFLSSTRVIR